MGPETEKVQSLEKQEPKRIPIAVLTRNGGREIFLVRNIQAIKYVPNYWHLLLPREFMGEETPNDLHTLIRDLGFITREWKSICSISGDGFHEYLAHGRPVEFDFCEFPVISGGFDPQLIYPENPESIYNQLVNLEGKWFTKRKLKTELELDPLVQKFLELSKTQ